MDVAVIDLASQRTGEVRGHSLGLGNLLGLKALTFEHVLEVHVAADVELQGALEANTTVLK